MRLSKEAIYAPPCLCSPLHNSMPYHLSFLRPGLHPGPVRGVRGVAQKGHLAGVLGQRDLKFRHLVVLGIYIFSAGSENCQDSGHLQTGYHDKAAWLSCSCQELGRSWLSRAARSND